MRDPVAERFDALFGPEFGHGKAFDLARLRAALSKLGDPQNKLPPVIHVAGTNGKGSTIAFMRAIAEASGRTVHAFTKPHLFALNERFLVAGNTARDAALIEAAERVAAASTDLTQFDAQVAAAFLLFSETPADLVLLETGMGGRDDSTNVIEKPALVIITSIGLDHQDALGGTLESIAEHKAGVMKPGVPALLGSVGIELCRLIEAHADAIGAPISPLGAGWGAADIGGRLLFETEHGATTLPLPHMRGRRQHDNAALAAMAMTLVIDARERDIAAGFRNARLSARLEPLTRGPFSAPIRESGGQVWVDVAHNGPAIGAALHELGSDTVAIVGLRQRKNAGDILDKMKGRVRLFIAAPFLGDCFPADQLAALARERGINTEVAFSLADAMQIAARLPTPRVLICGTFVLAAAALAAENA